MRKDLLAPERQQHIPVAGGLSFLFPLCNQSLRRR